jgi:hypothetical protein
VIISPPDPRLCSAAQNLSQAMALAATAFTADEHGDLARAQGLATQSRTLGELANATLHQMPDEEQSKPAREALLSAYGHVGQAANSLLPAYSSSHSSGREEYEQASKSMADARAILPDMCFALPADIETPRTS